MIHSFKYCKEKIGDLGEVTEFKGSLVGVSGLKKSFIGEGVVFENDKKGVVLSVNNEKTIVSVFSGDSIIPGTKAAATGNKLRITVGDSMLGSIISPLGYDLDGDKDRSLNTALLEIDKEVLNLSKRRRITKFLETGVSVCDLITPMGQGQRELVVGDRKTGKSHFLYQAALSQASKGKIVIYAFIGKKTVEIQKAVSFFRKQKIMQNCVLVSAPASSSPGEIFIAPFTAMTIAEYFRDMGRDSLVILDDMTTHAKFYREISLMAGKFPGRESYPGDIFFTHARLLERAGNFDIDGKDVSITAFPVAETYGGDFAGYIQTNLASITDGHLYFDENLFLKGVRPAINIFLSVTRVGRQTQTPLSRSAGSYILSLLKKHAELNRYLKFGTEMTDDVKKIVQIGNSLFSFFNQVGYKVYSQEYSLVAVAMIIAGKKLGENYQNVENKLKKIKPKLSKIDNFEELISFLKK